MWQIRLNLAEDDSSPEHGGKGARCVDSTESVGTSGGEVGPSIALHVATFTDRDRA